MRRVDLKMVMDVKKTLATELEAPMPISRNASDTTSARASSLLIQKVSSDLSRTYIRAASPLQ